MKTILDISILINFLCFGIVYGQNYNVLNFDAKGDGQTDDSKAFLQAWTAACGGDGDIKTLLIPSDKTFLLQPTVFQGPCKSSSIKVQLDGAIVAPSEKVAWSDPISRMWIKFSTVSGLIIVGSGTIDSRGSSFWELNLKASQRPTALHISKCDNLRINGITSIDSPKNHISIKTCNTVAISNINLFAPETSPNTDGIDISDSTNINIFDSTIQTGDDCIAINSGSSNINITGINCGPGHGISVGSLGAGGAEAKVSDVHVTHCTFNQTTNGARIKTWLESSVAISNVKYVDFRGTSSNKNAITLKCSETTHCIDVVMDGIDITMANGGKPKVNCQYVDGESSDTDLMRDCFKNITSS
ncbi:unnamed protein product [Arabidopsis arenosa]|uniref:Polygalacturonase n=1 Tax=Arabidopsis arenosa TaxID=38785 RepID=A0A8S2AZH5_ARAAE|nr:unnamed protein product [Arabidopsis arenosa]